jgi:hypothetical protein
VFEDSCFNSQIIHHFNSKHPIFAGRDNTFFDNLIILLFFRYHLQAFRHLYVLAAEKRIVIPRDVDSNQACYVEIEIVYKVCIIIYLEFVKDLVLEQQSSSAGVRT